VVSEVSGSNGVLRKAVVLFCEISGSSVLVDWLLPGTCVLRTEQKNILPRKKWSSSRRTGCWAVCPLLQSSAQVGFCSLVF